MALLHKATLRPTKLELLAGWLPGRAWYRGDPDADVVRVAGYRFDDPAGAVGIETMLVRAGDGPVHQVPLTYRDAPLPGADEWLIGTSEHSVLGRRWVYDGCADPVYVAALISVIFGGAGQADEFVEVDGRPELRKASMQVNGTGGSVGAPTVGVFRPAVDVLRCTVTDGPTLIVTDAVELTVVRRPGSAADRHPGSAGDGVHGVGLTGHWAGLPAPLPLAYAVPR